LRVVGRSVSGGPQRSRQPLLRGCGVEAESRERRPSCELFKGSVGKLSHVDEMDDLSWCFLK